MQHQLKTLKNNQKYYAEKTQKAHNRFLTKLYAHASQKNAVDAHRKAHDALAELEEERVEYVHVGGEPLYAQLIAREEDLKLDTQVHLRYLKVAKSAVAAQNKEIRNRRGILKAPERFEIEDVFGVWYYTHTLQDHLRAFVQAGGELLRELQLVQEEAARAFRPAFACQQAAKLARRKGPAAQNSLKLEFLVDERGQVKILQRPSGAPGSDQELCNKLQFDALMQRLVRSVVAEDLSPQLATFLQQPKLRIDQFKSILKDLQSCMCITGFRGNLIPSIYLREKVDHYIKSMEDANG